MRAAKRVGMGEAERSSAPYLRTESLEVVYLFSVVHRGLGNIKAQLTRRRLLLNESNPSHPTPRLPLISLCANLQLFH